MSNKKTEKVEIRVSPDLKLRLSKHCEDKQQSVSDVLRNSIEKELSLAPAKQKGVQMKFSSKTVSRTAIACILSVAAIGSIPLMASQTAIASPDFKRFFEDLDKNKDGVLTKEEFQGDNVVFVSEVKVDVEHKSDENAEPDCHNVVVKKSKQELPAFQMHDKNKDGKVTFEEFEKSFDLEIETALDQVGLELDQKDIKVQKFIAKENKATVLPELAELGDCHAEIEAILATTLNEEHFDDDAIVRKKIIKREKLTKEDFHKLDKNNDGSLSQDEYLDR
ncbi:EF-hand domain-containing protein [Hirschia maritima]|uniref:EF-hand domain-containing protein n=1 Tax=Hirschia maritima TaxID=1121961 RepID=UPI000380FFB5|nr:EF-hand domain-containing protein [Hirschia maritima]